MSVLTDLIYGGSNAVAGLTEGAAVVFCCTVPSPVSYLLLIFLSNVR